MNMEKEIYMPEEPNIHFIDGSMHYERFNPWVIIVVCDGCGNEDDLHCIGGNEHLCTECKTEIETF